MRSIPTQELAMPRIPAPICRSLILAALAVAATGPAQAQAGASATASPLSASSPVNITARREPHAPRQDVSKVCPAVHAELPEALASAWHAVNRGGVVKLRFTLEGSQVLVARASEGPRAYHRWVRSAIQGVSCTSDQPGRQEFEVAVRFADPSELGANKVALLTR
jgi:hypothetical protein